MKKTRFHKLFRYHVRRLAYNIKLLRVLKSISREKYDEKVSASLLLWFSISDSPVNFFFQPGHVYSSGATGLAQILSVLSQRFIGFYDSRFLDLLCHQYPFDDCGLVSNWP